MIHSSTNNSSLIIVYPVIVHNVWSDSGFLSASAKNPLFGTGMVDFAGSGVVHLTGGVTALISTWLLGPRKGRFFDDKGEKLSEPAIFAGHSKSLQVCIYIVITIFAICTIYIYIYISK
jgi:ammonium transporter, Amt family